MGYESDMNMKIQLGFGAGLSLLVLIFMFAGSAPAESCMSAEGVDDLCSDDEGIKMTDLMFGIDDLDGSAMGVIALICSILQLLLAGAATFFYIKKKDNKKTMQLSGAALVFGVIVCA